MAEREVVPPPPWEKKDNFPPPPWEKGRGGETRQTARKHLAELYTQRGKELETAEPQRAKSDIIEKVAEVAPAVAIAPLTEGMSLGEAVGAQAAAGVVGGVLREGVRAHYGQPPSQKNLALAFGVDAAVGAGGELTGQGLQYAAEHMMPKMVALSAGQSAKGRAILEMKELETAQKLTETVRAAAKTSPVHKVADGKIVINISEPLNRALIALDKLPKATAAKEAEATGGPTMVKSLMEQLNTANGSIAAHQPLELLIEARAGLLKAAAKTDNRQEKIIYKQFIDRIDGPVKDAVKKLGPQAQALLKQRISYAQTEAEADTAVNLAKKVLSKFVRSPASTTVAGAALGGYEGYKKEGAKGMAEGVVAGAGAGFGAALLSNTSAWALQKTMTNPVAARSLERAIKFALNGQEYQAREMMERAFLVAGVRNAAKAHIRHALEGPESGTAVEQKDPLLFRRP